MKKLYMLMAVLMVVGCSKIKPITTVNSSVQPKASISDMQKATYLAASEIGWVVTRVNANTLQAQVNNRQHEVTVLINYTSDGYNIKYKSSKNMLYSSEDNMIHRNYYRWVKKLDDNIRTNIYKVRAENAR